MASLFIATLDSRRDRIDQEKSVAAALDRHLVIRQFSDATYPELIDIERRGHGFYAWGLGPEADHLEAWFHMNRGDFVLFSQNGTCRFQARVLGRYESAGAARAIWGEPTPDTPLRELLFFLSEPVPLTVPWRDLGDYIQPPDAPFARVDPAIIDRLEADYGSVERFVRRRLLNITAGGPVLDMSGMIRLSERDFERLRSMEPADSKQARQAVVDTIIRRRGLPQFRHTLLEAYDYRCAITNCNAVETLEAATILPFRGRDTHQPANGLLLRADVHTLFDLGRIAIDTQSMSVVTADDLAETSYRLLAGKPLRYPQDETQRPDKEALDLHRRLAGL